MSASSRGIDWGCLTYIIFIGLIFEGAPILEAAKDFYNDVFLGRAAVSAELSQRCDDALGRSPRNQNTKVFLVGTQRNVFEGSFLPIDRDITVTVNQDPTNREALSVGANGYARAGVDHGVVRAVNRDGREVTVSVGSRENILRTPISRELTVNMNCVGISPEGEKFFARRR